LQRHSNAINDISQDLQEITITDFLNHGSFGTRVDFTRFYAKRQHDKPLLQLHYDLKDTKAARNSAAHGACLLNELTLHRGMRRSLSTPVRQALYLSQISKKLRASG
jgi:hypothetical protein